MGNKIVIAIDGYSSTGKSTLAKLLAYHLGYIYIDTGAMYRSVALFALESGFIYDNKIDTSALYDALDDIKIYFQRDPQSGYPIPFLNECAVTDKIRTLEVSKWVSPIAALSKVRQKLVFEQQQMAKSKGVVMDGRDIGTVVFPDAELKLFVTASLEVRTARRFKELQEKEHNLSLEAVQQNLQQRDHIDSTRADSPLKQALDAVLVDNTHTTIAQQVQYLTELAQQRGAACKKDLDYKYVF